MRDECRKKTIQSLFFYLENIPRRMKMKRYHPTYLWRNSISILGAVQEEIPFRRAADWVDWVISDAKVSWHVAARDCAHASETLKTPAFAIQFVNPFGDWTFFCLNLLFVYDNERYKYHIYFFTFNFIFLRILFETYI